jgi:hypothetical protein
MISSNSPASAPAYVNDGDRAAMRRLDNDHRAPRR